jgi:phospholipase C
MIQFLELVTGVKTDQITSWRRRAAGDLTSVFDFTATAPAPALCRPGEVPAFVARWAPEPPDVQQLPAQEEGRRPARALPYQPDAFAVVDSSVDVTMTNDGTRPAHFSVYCWHDVTTDPLHVDVDPASPQRIAVPCAGLDYDVTVLGPNRFLRDFAGSRRGRGAAVHVRSAVDVPPGRVGAARFRALIVSIENAGREAVDVTVAHLAYAESDPVATSIAAGCNHRLTVVTDLADGWYDLELTVAGDRSFRRRLTGHLEDGLPSVSG